MTGRAGAALAAALALLAAGCARDDPGNGVAGAEPEAPSTITVTGAAGPHRFHLELASTAAQQERGLMYRTDLKPDDAMLFWPYPPQGGPPQQATFWMKNTPTPLDIVFIRADGTVARIAENAAPFSEAPIPSGEPVAAVLEIVGGRAAEVGLSEGDRVTLPVRR